MLVYVYDRSKGKAYVKNRRRCSSLLFSISKRSYIGDLPYKIIKQLLLELKKDATKSSSTLILVQSNTAGYMGWKGFSVGKEIEERFNPFILAESYIDFEK